MAGLNFKEVNFLVNDVTTDMHLKAWDPFCDAPEATRLIVSYHLGTSQQIVDGETAHLSASEKRRIVRDNAAALYRL